MTARLALSLLCSLQVIATLVIDLNRTHATHPGWMRHARFHLVWQAACVTLICGLSLALLWIPGLASTESFYLAVILAALSPAAFLVALATKSLYNGALSDPGGINPAVWRRHNVTITVDMNLMAVAAALLALGIIVAIYVY